MIRKQGPPQTSPGTPSTSRRTDPPARPRQVGPARPTKSRTTPRGQNTGETRMTSTGPRDRKSRTRPDWRWQDKAACRGLDIELFFGPDGERGSEREYREWNASQVCAGCPVRSECLDYAVDRPEKYGMYGGMNEDERKAERRRRMRRPSAA
jgi:WhiB family transcriptional regulator, redox-sensing transcriptional regulator